MGKKGFTLVELMVTVAVIGILASIGIVFYGAVLIRTRDTQRLKDLRTIEQALELYRGDIHSYPAAADFVLSSASAELTNSAGTVVYLSNVPVDSDSSRHYYYSSSADLTSFILCASREGSDTSNDLADCSNTSLVPAGSCGTDCNIGISSR